MPVTANEIIVVSLCYIEGIVLIGSTEKTIKDARRYLI
jgi:hypothetical protein